MSNLVPGVMRCAKCGFEVVRKILHVNSGTIGPGDSKTEPCPNECGPLWPVTWEQWAADGWKAAEIAHEESKQHKRMFEAAAGALAEIDRALGIGADGCGDSTLTIEAVQALVKKNQEAIRLLNAWRELDAEEVVVDEQWHVAIPTDAWDQAQEGLDEWLDGDEGEGEEQ